MILAVAILHEVWKKAEEMSREGCESGAEETFNRPQRWPGEQQNPSMNLLLSLTLILHCSSLFESAKLHTVLSY